MTNDKEIVIPRQFGFSTCLAGISAELSKTYNHLEIAKRALKDIKRKLLTIDVSNLSSWDRDKLYNIMFHDGIIDKALNKIEECDQLEAKKGLDK